MKKPYIVEPNTIDAARPYKVVAIFRTFNRVMGTYETEGQAIAACIYRNRKSTVKV